MIVLSKDQILLLHKQLIKGTGGSEGIRDEGLLDAAINAPFQSFDGKDIFLTVEEKAARLGYGLVRNHAFVDGNKRIGAHAMLVFLVLNGVELTYTQDELSDVFLNIASGGYEYEDLLSWVREHIRL